MTLAEQLATLLEQGHDQPRHRVVAATELRRLRAEVDQLRAALTALREQPAVAQPLTDEQIIEIRQQTRFGKIGPWADTLAIARAIQRACADAWGVTLREPK